MFDVEGFILVGGASSRMGADKSRLDFNGRTSVELIAETLQQVAGRVSTVGSRVDERDCNSRNIPDLHPQWGPLGGIQAALQACVAESCIIVACDLVLVSSDLLGYLIRSMTQEVEAVVPLQSDSRPQPLCAVYRRAACLKAAETAIENGEHRPRDLLDKVRTRYINFAEIAGLAGSENFFFNINTPQDYERARTILESDQGL